MILNLRFQEKAVSYWSAERLLASHNGLANKFFISGLKRTQHVLNLMNCIKVTSVEMMYQYCQHRK